MSSHFKGFIKGFSLTAIILAGSTTINHLSATETTASGQGNTAAAKNRYVVTFYSNAEIMSGGTISLSGANNLLQTYGATPLRTLDIINAMAVEIDPSHITDLLKDPQIKHVEVDQPRYLLTTPETAKSPAPQAEITPYGIGMIQADQLSDANTGYEKICIVGTGYDINHEDLISSGITGDDNNGQGNDSGNWDHDGQGQGSHIAGIISAIGNNNTGVVGVNPGGNIKLHIVKVFNDTGNWVYGSDLIAAISQCQNAGANIINIGFGGSNSMIAESEAFDWAYEYSVLPVAAAGNSGNSSLIYPAAYRQVLSVGAVDSNETVAAFSNHNALVELAAPGVDIASTIPGGYASLSGTAMAAGYISGVAALVHSLHPDCHMAFIRYALRESAKDTGDAGRDDYYGHGIVQAKSADDYLNRESCPSIPPRPVSGEEQNLEARRNTWQRFNVEMPSGIRSFRVKISGGSGDADLYVKEGSEPSSGWLGEYDCRPYLNGNEEICTFSNPGQGTWYIGVKAYSSYQGVKLEWAGF